MPRPAIYTTLEKTAFVEKARRMMREGANRKDIAVHLGVKLSSLNVWLRQHTLDSIYPSVSLDYPIRRAI